MIQGWSAVYFREALLLRRRFWKTLGTMSVSPLLYILAFGWAMAPAGQQGGGMGQDYLRFLLPGLAAMSSMTQAWAIAGEINVARFYWRIFEEIQAAPVAPGGYVLGEVLAGMTRALLGVLAVLTLGLAFGVRLSFGPAFWLALLLNAFFFASLAVGLAMHIKAHADQALLTSFVITPMAFLGGTFFSLTYLPSDLRYVIYLLPLTHASICLRSSLLGQTVPDASLFALVAFLTLFSGASLLVLRRKEA